MPNKVSEQGIVEEKPTPTTYDFRQKTLFAPPILPSKISPSPEQVIQIQKLPVKTMAKAFGSGEKNDRPAIEDIVKEIEKYDWDVAIALKVARCESNFNPNAINWGDAKITGLPSMGIFQLNRPYDEKYFDYKINIRIAYEEFYAPRFWQPWSCSYILGIL